MNIGSRIVERLNALGWERKDLLDRVPDLSAQSLSNLIRRDSARSEWDLKIADALGLSVLELVYGLSPRHTAEEPESSPYGDTATGDDELLLLSAFRAASPEVKAAMLGVARTVPGPNINFPRRNGTR